MEGFFERVPVAVVKRMMEQRLVSAEAVSSEKERHASEGWRALAEQVQHETDSRKMLKLVEQLIDKYDEETERKMLAPGIRAKL